MKIIIRILIRIMKGNTKDNKSNNNKNMNMNNTNNTIYIHKIGIILVMRMIILTIIRIDNNVL